MAVEFKPYLLLALHELDHFSVPGVGTFVRRREKARFDPESNKLFPPQEVTELKRGDDMLDAFVQFLVVKTQKPRVEAENLAREIGTTVVQYVQSLVDIELEGFGTIKKGPYNLPVFEPVETDEQVENFGLVPVAIQLGGRKEVKPTPVEPPTPKTTAKPTAKPEAKATPKRVLEPRKAAPAARKKAAPTRAKQPQSASKPRRTLLVVVLIVLAGAMGTLVALNWDRIMGAASSGGTTPAQVEEGSAPGPTPDSAKGDTLKPKKPSAFPSPN